MNKEQLEKYQSVVYRVLYNALSKNNVASSYLFVGDDSTIIKETAILLAKSLLCKNDIFACDNCDVCYQIESQTFPDLIFLDGSIESIKKQQILDLQEQFNKSGSEIYEKKIYILHLVENATPDAMNSLLKFLEEPVRDVFAILTTANLSRVLSTVISRCQCIKFKPMPIELCVDLCVNKGFDRDDVNILARIYRNDLEVERVINDVAYEAIRNTTLAILKAFLRNPNAGIYKMQGFFKENKEIAKKDLKESYLLMLDIMIVFFNECIQKNFKSNLELWDGLVSNSENNDNKFILEILLQTKDSLQRSPNVALIFDKMMFQMKEGVSNE